MATAIRLVGGGLTISLSVTWDFRPPRRAVERDPLSRAPFADYLALRGPLGAISCIGAIALAVLVMGWEGYRTRSGARQRPDSWWMC